MSRNKNCCFFKFLDIESLAKLAQPVILETLLKKHFEGFISNNRFLLLGFEIDVTKIFIIHSSVFAAVFAWWI